MLFWFLVELFFFTFRKTKNILIFNVTGKRDYETFLKILLKENRMDLVIVCPIVTCLNDNRPGVQFFNICYYMYIFWKCLPHNFANPIPTL